MSVDIQILSKLIDNPQLYFEHQNLIQHLSFSGNNVFIYEAIERLILDDKLDKINLTREIRKHNSSDLNIHLTNIFVDFGNNEFRSLLFEHLDSGLKTKLYKIFDSCQTRLETGEFVVSLIEGLQDDLSKLVNFEQSKVKKIDELMNDVLSVIETNQRIDQPFTGIETGFEYFDKHTKGLQKSDLIIVAGETSQGKTSLALNMVRDADCSCAIFSLEMTSLQLTARLMAQSSEINSKTLLFEKVDKSQYDIIGNGITKLKNRNIYIDDLSSNSVYTIISSIKQMKIKYNIDVAIVDYLQLVNDEKTKGREQEVGQIARRFKNIAKQLDICIILISQLSRDKHNPKPSLSRLRDSGQIEEAADIVCFTYRPEFYGKDKLDPVFDERIEHWNSKGLAQIIIAKGRNVGITEFVLQYIPEYTLFKNYYHVDTPSENGIIRQNPYDNDPF